MVTNKFDYVRAESVDDAISLMVKHGMDAKILAGGHSLIPAMKLRLNAPGVLIDIRKIQELRYIKKDGNSLVIGAGATHHDIATSELAGAAYSMLPEAADLIGDQQVRNMGTIGGSLAHADPAADWPGVMIAARAAIHLKGPDGERSVPAEDFFTGFYMTDLQENELVTAISIPLPAEGTKSAYQKFMQPASRFAIVGAAVSIAVKDGKVAQVKVGINGLADAAFAANNIEQALLGQAPTEANIDNAVEGTGADAMVMSDHFASEEYRLHLAKVYAKRALMAATQ
ncbi:MAG: xanthine dehydrogenase family protein subunit M [Phaeodactylibacter sp.]|nr:xanthine dehydrogenase family protein subunit M [Phaeodactylibacter sp.]